LVDTTDARFLNLTVDPYELAKLLDDYAKSKKKIQNGMLSLNKGRIQQATVANNISSDKSIIILKLVVLI